MMGASPQITGSSGICTPDDLFAGVEISGDVLTVEGIANCIEGYRQIVGLAERSGVTLVLEPLNTRDPAPMKGHPAPVYCVTDFGPVMTSTCSINPVSRSCANSPPPGNGSFGTTSLFLEWKTA